MNFRAYKVYLKRLLEMILRIVKIVCHRGKKVSVVYTVNVGLLSLVSSHEELLQKRRRKLARP